MRRTRSEKKEDNLNKCKGGVKKNEGKGHQRARRKKTRYADRDKDENRLHMRLDIQREVGVISCKTKL